MEYNCYFDSFCARARARLRSMAMEVDDVMEGVGGCDDVIDLT